MNKYIKPDICIVKMSDEILQQLVIASPGKDDVPAEEVDAKQQDYFDEMALIDKYIPDAFTSIFPTEEESFFGHKK